MLIYSTQRSDDPWATDESDSSKCNSEKAETSKECSVRNVIYRYIGPLIEKYRPYMAKFSIFLSIIILAGIAYQILSEDTGLVIQSFATNDCGNNLDGTDIAQLLACELMDIQSTNEKANSIQADAIYSIIAIMTTYQGQNHNQEQFHQQGQEQTHYNQPSISIQQTESSLNYLKNIGTISVAGTSLSIGNLYLFIISQIKKPTVAISGNLQIYGSNIILVAALENSSNEHTVSWKVTRTLNGSSIDEAVPSMVSELAFDIYSSPDSGLANEIDIKEDWQTFKEFEKGEKSLNNYMINNNISELMEA